jgi:DNA-binding MarR family transcriptional regulator
VARDDNHRFGAIRDETLNIPGDDIPLEGVVANLCMRTAFQSEGICQDCIDDLAMEFARQSLEGQTREHWFTAWLEDTQIRYPDSPLSYHPSWTYRFIHRMVGDEGLDEIVREVREMNRCEILMGREDYVIFLKTRLRRFVVPLNSTELRLLGHLLHRPVASQKRISKEMGMSPQWISQKIKELGLRRVLHRYETVPLSWIGIRRFHVLLGCENEPRNLMSYLTSSPFLYSSHKFMTGVWDLEATLRIPDCKVNIRALERFTEEMGKRGVHAELFEVASEGVSHCFDHYSTADSGWNIPWEIMRVQLGKIYNDRLADVIPQLDEWANRTKLYLDEVDMRILSLAQKGITSISQVRSRLRMAQATVAKKLRRLKESGLIKQRYSAQNIGRVEKILMITDDRRAGQSISAWVQRLPKARVAYTPEDVLYCQASLPVGGAYGAMWSVDVLPVRLTAGLLSLPAVFNYWIPHRLWDVDNQGWRHSSEELEKWFESLEEADREVRPQSTWA